MNKAVINLTFCIVKERVQEWNHWLMKSVIPAFMEESWVREWHVEQVMSRTADADYSFALRLHSDSLDDAREYYNTHLQELAELGYREFGDDVICLTTLLAVVQ